MWPCGGGPDVAARHRHVCVCMCVHINLAQLCQFGDASDARPRNLRAPANQDPHRSSSHVPTTPLEPFFVTCCASFLFADVNHRHHDMLGTFRVIPWYFTTCITLAANLFPGIAVPYFDIQGTLHVRPARTPFHHVRHTHGMWLWCISFTIHATHERVLTSTRMHHETPICRIPTLPVQVVPDRR